MKNFLRGANDFKKIFNLPPNYEIKGFLNYGSWDREANTLRMQRKLAEHGVSFSVRTLPWFLSPVTEITIEDSKYWFTVMYGGALLSEMTHLACLFGSQKNIHIGGCGGLYPKMQDLDLLIPTWSYGNESSTRMYEAAADHRHWSNQELRKSINGKVHQQYTVWEGPIMTNQAMMAETMEDVHQWSKEGFYGVEMETATIFAVSNHFSVPSGSILYMGDNLIRGQVSGDESHVNQKERREAAIDDIYSIGLQTLLED